jgi:hypothetical protein
MSILRFPLRALAAVLVTREPDGGWLVLARSHGWVCGSLGEARAEARWLARNLGGLPIRELSR